MFLAFTCSSADPVGECPTLPADGSNGAALLAGGRSQAAFEFLYPCYLPNSQTLRSVSVIGDRGKQSVTISWEGPFELTFQQSQIAPLVTADPAGASRRVVQDLFPGTKAELLEISDGSSRGSYRLVWSREGFYYELLAVGPHQQSRVVLQVARSLQ